MGILAGSNRHFGVVAETEAQTVAVTEAETEAVTEAETESVIEAESVTVAVTVSVSVSESETESVAETEAVTAVLAGLRQAANQLNSGILLPGGSLGAKLRHAGELQQLDRQD